MLELLRPFKENPTAMGWTSESDEAWLFFRDLALLRDPINEPVSSLVIGTEFWSRPDRNEDAMFSTRSSQSAFCPTSKDVLLFDSRFNDQRTQYQRHVKAPGWRSHCFKVLNGMLS